MPCGVPRKNEAGGDQDKPDDGDDESEIYGRVPGTDGGEYE